LEDQNTRFDLFYLCTIKLTSSSQLKVTLYFFLRFFKEKCLLCQWDGTRLWCIPSSLPTLSQMS